MAVCPGAACGFHLFSNVGRICHFNLGSCCFPMANGALNILEFFSLYQKYNAHIFMPHIVEEERAELQARVLKVIFFQFLVFITPVE